MYRFDQGFIEFPELKEVYTTRLNIPHSTMTETFQAYSSLITKYDDANYEATMIACSPDYNAALKEYEVCEAHEVDLKTAEYSLEAFGQYINWQTKRSSRHPSYKQLTAFLFMRALASHRLCTELWDQYYHYISKTSGSEPSTEAAQKAARNCPWSGDLWANYIRSLDKCGKGLDLIHSTQARALATDLIADGKQLVNLFSATFAAIRHNQEILKEDKSNVSLQYLKEASSHLRKIGYYDSECILERLEIVIQTEEGLVEQARANWKRLVKYCGHEVMFNLRYLEWECRFGTLVHARTLLRAAVLRVKDAPQVIFDTAKFFEVEHGSAEDYEKTLAAVRKASEQLLSVCFMSIRLNDFG